MAEIFSIENLTTLAMLVLLQAVLGFDNLLYISIESKRVEPSQQARVRQMGIILAVVLRIVLLFVLISAIGYFQKPFFAFDLPGIAKGSFNLHGFVVLVGGILLLYTALKEIFHLLSIEHLEESVEGNASRSVAGAIFWIVAMNLIFSFDSIISAMALTEVFWVMAVAIVISGIMMLWLADHVSEFLKKNRLYEVLGLFILFIVGIMLISEGGHLAHLSFFGYPIEPMAKSTFYFVIFVLVAIDIVQGRYQRRLNAKRQAEAGERHG